MDKVQNMNMRDELSGSTEITPEKNVDKEQEMAEFSSPISEVMDQPQAGAQMMSSEGYMPEPRYAGPAPISGGKYPLNLKRHQVEALLAGVAAVLGTSDTVQGKIADMVPQFYNEAGKISATGMAILVLVVAIIFYFGKQFILDRR